MSALEPSFLPKGPQAKPYDATKLNNQDVDELLAAAQNHAGLLNALSLRFNSLGGNFRAGSLLDLPVPVGRFNGYNQSFSDGANQVSTYAYIFTPRFTTVGGRFCFGNWSLGWSNAFQPNEVPGLNDIVIHAGVYTGNDIFPLTFNGATSVRITPGATIKSDPTPYKLPAGQDLYLRVTVSVDTAGQKWPLGTVCDQFVATDSAMSGGIPNSNIPGYGPFALIGTPLAQKLYKTPTIVGDSVSVGLEDAPDMGYIRRGLDDAGLPWLRFGCSSMRMAHVSRNRSAFTLTNLAGSELIINELGINDVEFFNSFAEAKAAFLAFWEELASTGAEVWQTTLTPRSGMSAQHATIRGQLNDWFRSVPAPLSKCLDVSPYCETAPNSNIWLPGLSGDNIHPNTTGAKEIAPVITIEDFLL